MSQINIKISLVLLSLFSNLIISPKESDIIKIPSLKFTLGDTSFVQNLNEATKIEAKNQKPEKTTRYFRIKFLLSRLMRLEENGVRVEEEVGAKMLNYVKDVLKNASRIVNMYVQVKTACSQKKLMIYSAHDMYVSVEILEKEQVIASMTSYEERRIRNEGRFKSVILELSKKVLERMIGLGDFDKMSYTLVMVHELIHAFGFLESNFSKSLNKDTINSCIKISPNQKEFMIALIESLNFKTNFVNDHWGDHKLPNDIMVSRDTNKRYISLYTRFLLQDLNPSLNFEFDNDSLMPDPNFPDLETAKSLWNYECKDNIASLVPAFCSLKDKNDEYFGCNQDFTARTFCDEIQLPNRCFARVELAEYNCMNSGSKRKRLYFENLGENSRCFEGFDEKKKSYCLKIDNSTFDNTSDQQIIRVTLKNEKLDCIKGHYIVLNSYREPNKDKLFLITPDKPKEKYHLWIKCPDPMKFRNEYRNTNCPEQCRFQGFCKAGKCLCFEGFSGVNCSNEDPNIIFWSFGKLIRV
jgi:hypothetical protein